MNYLGCFQNILFAKNVIQTLPKDVVRNIFSFLDEKSRKTMIEYSIKLEPQKKKIYQIKPIQKKDITYQLYENTTLKKISKKKNKKRYVKKNFKKTRNEKQIKGWDEYMEEQEFKQDFKKGQKSFYTAYNNVYFYHWDLFTNNPNWLCLSKQGKLTPFFYYNENYFTSEEIEYIK